jgi:hypothetical protein
MRTKYIPVINHKLKYIIGNCKERQKKIRTLVQHSKFGHRNRKIIIVAQFFFHRSKDGARLRLRSKKNRLFLKLNIFFNINLFFLFFFSENIQNYKGISKKSISRDQRLLTLLASGPT